MGSLSSNTTSSVIVSPGWTSRGRGTRASVSSSSPVGFTPAQLQAAYGLTTLTGNGAGKTVAIVDAYEDPNAQADLNVYRARFGLPACSSGWFTKVNERGGATPPATDPTG